MLDYKMNFKCHVKATMTKALERIMPNIGGPGANRVALLGVVHSTMLYGAPVWHRVVGQKYIGRC